MKKIIITISMFLIALAPIHAANKFKVTLDKCVDGDTAKFIINDESKTVRFLSINTPELAHYGNKAEAYGNEASEYTCTNLKNAKTIKLEYDPNSDETDKYGRILAWVFVDNELLQKKLIQEGLAEVKYIYGDYLYTSELQALELAAQEKKLGMWSDAVQSTQETEILTKYQTIIYIVAIISIVIISIFGKNKTNKNKAIKKIKKIANI